MLLFSIINLNVLSTFIYLSYSALILIYFVSCFILFIFLAMSTCTFDFVTVILLIVLFHAMLLFLLTDTLIDNVYGITEIPTLYRTVQHCFIWFILSEAALFTSFFWASFALNLLMSLEFSTVLTVFPIMYSYTLVNSGFIFYWVYLDLFNIIINTFLLFFSGIFCNLFNVLIMYNNIYISSIFCVLSLISGFLFIWNQLWEFSLLTFTISTSSFCSTLLSIDLLHFSHVSLGVFFILMSLINIINQHISSSSLLFFTCIILYWHFVDFVWFLLLSFLYFNMLCIFLL